MVSKWSTEKLNLIRFCIGKSLHDLSKFLIWPIVDNFQPPIFCRLIYPRLHKNTQLSLSLKRHSNNIKS